MWYRLYELDDADRILKAADLECPNDAEAMAAADARWGAHGFEVWQEARRVGGVSSRQPQPATA